MMVDGIPCSQRGSVDDIVASGGILARGQSVRHVGMFFGTRLAFHFSEISLGMSLGRHGQVDGICGLVWGCQTHKEE
jgi:hypothetical protein